MTTKRYSIEKNCFIPRRRDWFLTLYPPAVKTTAEQDQAKHDKEQALHDRVEAEMLSAKEILKYLYTSVHYIHYSVERGDENHKVHCHVYVRYQTVKSRAQVVKSYPRFAVHDCGKPKSTQSILRYINEDYDKQDQNYVSGPFVYGVRPTWTDNENIAYDVIGMAKKGYTKEMIYEENPKLLYSSSAVNQALELFSPQADERPLKVIWVYGPSGCGKSTYCRNSYQGRKCCIEYKDSRFSTYSGQQCVIFDEIDKCYDLKLYELLKMMDKFVFPMNIKGGKFVDATYNFIYFNGIISPDEFCLCRSFTAEEKKQFMRRITDIVRMDEHYQPHAEPNPYRTSLVVHPPPTPVLSPEPVTRRLDEEGDSIVFDDYVMV